jgi:hypothetical protein
MNETPALHILCGSLAFVLALLTAKGGKAPRRSRSAEIRLCKNDDPC